MRPPRPLLDFERPAWTWPILAVLLYFTLSLTFAVQLPILRDHAWFPEDLRVHLPPFHKYSEAELFPNDHLTEISEAMLLPGMRAAYWVGTQLHQAAVFLGKDKLAARYFSVLGFSKLLVMPLMAVCVVYGFLFGRRLSGSNLAGVFCGCVAMVCFYDFISEGLQRSFAVPLLLAAVYHVMAGHRLRAGLAVFLPALFYPSTFLLAGGVFGFSFLGFRNFRPRLDLSDKVRLVYFVAAVALGIGVVLYHSHVVKTVDFKFSSYMPWEEIVFARGDYVVVDAARLLVEDESATEPDS